jgi:hypothetical protein
MAWHHLSERMVLYMLARIFLTLVCSWGLINAQATVSSAQLFGRGSDTTFEPFGAEDFGSEDLAVSIPEPLVFDLVRPLGAHQGEFEANVLGEFPLDGEAIDWAPEIEFTIADGLALEFEVPFENSRQLAYKFAGQLTFGTARDDTFIHGTQVILEPDIYFEHWDLTALYLAGLRFDDTWSMLVMLGGETEVVERDGFGQTSGIFNLSLFADTTEYSTVGIESNFVFGQSAATRYEVIPQLHLELTDNMELQIGCGVGFEQDRDYGLAATRAIVSW